MDFVKRYPLLTAVLAVCVTAFAVELFFLWRFSTNATTLQSQLKQSQSKAETAARQTPAPSDQNLADATKNVDDLNAELADVHKTLQDTPEKIEYTPPPKGDDAGTDLTVEIQQYADKMQAKATEKGVILPTPKNYGFGMALYVGQGVSPPPVDKIPAVYKQLKVLDYVVGHLLDDAKLPDQKMKIVSIDREDVASVTASVGGPPPGGDQGTSGLDLFVVDPTVTARVPGAINTLAFRIRFVGYSESLRILLNDLAKFDLPLVVRSIDVEPAQADRALTGPLPGPATGSAAAAAADNSARRPVITENFSQFTIVIEYVELPAPPASPAATDAAAASGTSPAAASGAAASGTAH